MATDSATQRKGYAIFRQEMTDWDRYLNEYLSSAAETIEDHSGIVLVGAPDPEIIEGKWGDNLTVVIEFPSVAAAHAWYTDPAYEEVKPIRHEASEYAHAIICPEFSPEDFEG